MSEKKVGSGPKTRMCYICGRQYGLSSFEIHIKQCRELWIAREALKVKSERKPVPKDPCAGGGGGGGGGGCDGLQDTLNNKGSSGMNLEEINRMASETFNTVSLSQCEHCGRSFLHEKLVIHNRSCTAEKPGRRAPVKADVAAASKVPEPTESPSPKKEKASAPQRSTTPQKSSGTGQAPQSSQKSSASPVSEKPKEEFAADASSPADSSSLPLAGHLGGTGGRPIRAANHCNSSEMNTENGSGTRHDDSAEIFELSRKVEEMEGIVEQLVASIAEVKQTLVTLRKNQAAAGNE
jgi:hypothetical protein